MKKALSILLALIICVGILPTATTTVTAAVDNTSPIYVRNRQLAESFVDEFEAALLNSFYIFNPVTGKMEYLSAESAELVDRYNNALKASDAYVLVFERTGNNFHIKRKIDGKYMKRQGDVINWVNNPSTAYAVEYKDNGIYNIYDSDNGDNLWSNESGELMFNGSRYENLSIYMKSGYMITYQLDRNSSYNSYAWLADDAVTYQFAHFIPETLPLTETGGRIIEYWKDGDNNRYVPGKDYNIDKSLVLTPVYHTHAYSDDPVIADGNTIGYVKHTCTCGASYMDGFEQEIGVKKVELVGDNLKITYTDGTSDDLGSVKGDKGDDGRQIEMRTTATHIQWRYSGDAEWTDLVALSEISGFKGDKGDTGAQGPQGDKGDKGDTGAQGPQGDKGDKGDTGAQGPQGDKGDKGDTGADGTDGKDGVDGKDGINGENGKDGSDGTNGKDGATPFIGENGNWWIGDSDTGVIAAIGKADVDSTPTGADVLDADRDLVKTLAIISLVLSAIALVCSAVALKVVLTKKKKAE